jgi:hypothetical protein
MILTINQERPITANHIAACFSILNHSLYFASSPAAVTILNHPHNNNHNTISDNNHKTRFKKFFITVINHHCFIVPSFVTPAIHHASSLAQNHP